MYKHNMIAATCTCSYNQRSLLKLSRSQAGEWSMGMRLQIKSFTGWGVEHGNEATN